VESQWLADSVAGASAQDEWSSGNPSISGTRHSSWQCRNSYAHYIVDGPIEVCPWNLRHTLGQRGNCTDIINYILLQSHLSLSIV
jgi:hypothetical protein